MRRLQYLRLVHRADMVSNGCGRTLCGKQCAIMSSKGSSKYGTACGSQNNNMYTPQKKRCCEELS